MAHAQKPDFFFKRNGRVHLNWRWGRQFSRLLRSRGVRISGSNAGYTTFRGSVKGTGYPLHSPVSPFTSPSRASQCAITCQLESTKVERSGNRKFAKDKLHKTAISVVINGANKITGFISMLCTYKRAGSCPLPCIKTIPVSSLCHVSYLLSAAISVGTLWASRLEGIGKGW